MSENDRTEVFNSDTGIIGKTIKHYTIKEKLGSGGMGTVYKARDLKLNRWVAIKFLQPHLSQIKEANVRFLQEAQAASSLDHNNICTIYEIDETPDGQLFIVMAHYHGDTLKEKIARGPLPLSEVLDIAGQVAEGLKDAHETRIVHRDIKPANIFITTKGQVKILDFGLAKLKGNKKLTREGTTMGTVAYMSPEQARGQEADHRSDLWSLGVMLYEMITGLHPFDGDNEQAVLYALMNNDYEPLTARRAGVPGEWEYLENKLLKKKPDERYQSTADIIVDLKSLRKYLETRGVSSTISLAKRKTNRISIFTGSLLLLCIIVITVLMLTPSRQTIDSLAILPFKNISGNPEMDYLCDGLTDSIIEDIQKIPELKKVAPRASTFFYKGKEIVPGDVARILGVRMLLFGELNLRGKEIIISVELVDGRENNRIWGERFTGPLLQITSIQEKICRRITEHLKIRSSDDKYLQMKKMHTADPEAYRLYLQGRFFFEKLTRKSLEKSIVLFRESIRRDPGYAKAYTKLANAYIELPIHSKLSKDQAYDLAMAAILKALEIDNTLSDAYSTLGNIKGTKTPFPLREMEQYFKKALSLDPNNIDAYHYYAHVLSRKGNRAAKGLQLMRRALKLDPLSENINGCMIELLLLNGEFEDALSQSKKLEEMYPGAMLNKWWRGWIYMEMGRVDEAIEHFKTLDVSPIFPLNRIASLGYAYGVQGRKDLAEEQLALLHKLNEKINFDPMNFTLIHAGLGQTDKALSQLERAVRINSPLIFGIKTFPGFRTLHNEPRFKNVLSAIGMDVKLDGGP